MARSYFTIIRKALNGDKKYSHWLYMLDHCRGIDLAYHTEKEGEVYNIGNRNEHNNNYIANKVCAILEELYPPSNVDTQLSTYKVTLLL